MKYSYELRNGNQIWDIAGYSGETPFKLCDVILETDTGYLTVENDDYIYSDVRYYPKDSVVIKAVKERKDE